MQQFLEKSFPMETELGDREMDLLAFQVCIFSRLTMTMCLIGDSEGSIVAEESHKSSRLVALKDGKSIEGCRAQ